MDSSPRFFLRLFGSPTLTGEDGVQLSGRAVQRRRLALLALLVLAPGRSSSREKLMAYLWPESDSESARNLLNVSVYVLRQELGEAVILSNGDELRLNAEWMRADVADFEAFLERGDPTGAVTPYQRPFLDGFFLSDASEFEHWMERERERLANGYARALETLAEAAEQERDFPRVSALQFRRSMSAP